jgi:glycerate-2-kinase
MPSGPAEPSAKTLAESIYREVLSQASGDRLVEASVRRAGDILFVQDEPLDLNHYGRVRIAGAGKASLAMAGALLDLFPDADGLIVGKADPQLPTRLANLEVIGAGHPVPNLESLTAGERMLGFARDCNADDLVLFCLSGGASALLEALVAEVSLEDLQRTTALLLASGAPITTINAVRRQLSRVKGGRLSTAFGNATVIVLVLSDVVSNDLSVVGSGPLYVASQKEQGQQATLAQHWTLTHQNELPSPVQEALLELRLPTTAPHRRHCVLGSPALLIPLAIEAARQHGLEPLPYADPLAGEARHRAHRIIRLARARVLGGAHPFCMIFVGETTVKLRHPEIPTIGGRCQEMAVAAALGLSGHSGLAFLAGGTDGNDGPTDAAGGLVDSETVVQNPDSIRAALETNSSYRWLQKCGALLKTGPTGSNLTDIALVVYRP